MPDLLGLGAVPAALRFQPTHHAVVVEALGVAANGGQQDLVAVPPVVANAHLALDPDEAAAELESPGIEDTRAVEQKSVGGPQMQVRCVSRQLTHWKRADFLDGHSGRGLYLLVVLVELSLVVLSSCRPGALVIVAPWRVGIDSAEGTPKRNQPVEVGNRACVIIGIGSADGFGGLATADLRAQVTDAKITLLG